VMSGMASGAVAVGGELGSANASTGVGAAEAGSSEAPSGGSTAEESALPASAVTVASAGATASLLGGAEGAGGPLGGPLGGPDGGPVGGPDGGPVGGPDGGPLGGPDGGPVGGPVGEGEGSGSTGADASVTGSREPMSPKASPNMLLSWEFSSSSRAFSAEVFGFAMLSPFHPHGAA
jgi:hypothetical protein